MKLAIVAPSPVPFLIGGAENLWWGLVDAFNRLPGVEADLIKLPSAERNAREIVASYRRFAELDLSHFDQVISSKYPAWMVEHPNHVVYVQHKLRGLYDTYPAHLPTAPDLAALPLALRRLLTEPAPGRAMLPELFARMEAWLDSQPDDHGFDLPGPRLRALVHQLDRIALAKGQIRRYLAISHTVAERADYFPAGVQVEVLHHPTDVQTRPASGYDAIFTASRLDGAKRIELLLRAYLAAGRNTPLRIAGSGPEEAKLKALAAGNPNVQFLGRITEAQLTEEYARALFVPFVPYQEDYGLITLEAMQSGKAVLTVADAGGVTELVQHGINGEVVETGEAPLAAAIQRLVDDPARTRAMGAAAAQTVAHIQWEPLARALLTAPARRKKVVVANTFPVYPPQGGGQIRLYQLYKGLALKADVVMVNLAPTEETAGTRELAPGFTEVLVPRTWSIREDNARLEQRIHVPCGDISAVLQCKMAPNFIAALGEACADADVVVASHPYAYPALKQVWDGPIYYESLNVEYDLKQGIYGADSPWLQAVKEVEGECARLSPHVFACSPADAERMAELYDLAPARFSVVPNGVDTVALPYHDPAERLAQRARLGLDARPLVLFMGSMHTPNVEALELLINVAAQRPELDFVVLGSVCWAFKQEAPANVRLLGVVDEEEKLAWLALADIGFNPMLSGSGTNLKILDYAAAGLAIVSTSFGARGGVLEPGQHFWQAEQAGLAELLAQVAALPVEARSAVTQAAREQVERTVDWKAVAAGYAEQLLA